MTLRPVIFDMDGVIADSEGIACEVVAELLDEYGATITKEEVRQRFVGMSDKYMLTTMAKEQDLTFPNDMHDLVRERSVQAYEHRLQAIPAMPELIMEHIFARCVASSSSPARIEATLKLIDLFDDLSPHIFSATMVKNGKPAPDLFLFAAKKMGWHSEDCIVVEDSKAGVEAGVAAGMTVIGLTAGEHLVHDEHAPQLLRLGASHVINDAKDLPGLLAQLGVEFA